MQDYPIHRRSQPPEIHPPTTMQPPDEGNKRPDTNINVRYLDVVSSTTYMQKIAESDCCQVIILSTHVSDGLYIYSLLEFTAPR